MPILYIEPPPPPREPVRVPRIPDNPCKSVIWTSSIGEVINFNDFPISMVPGRSGFGRVQHEVISDRLVDGGNFVQNYRQGTRVVTLPFQIKTQDLDMFATTLNKLDRAFQHRDYLGNVEPGTLRVVRHDDTGRSIQAFYHQGFDETEDLDHQVLGHQVFPNLEFWCPDPMWLGDERNIVWAALPPTGRYFYPLYPVTLRPSDISGEKSFENTSPEPIHPVWEFTGPGTPLLRELRSGMELEFMEPIPTGVTVRIDTRPLSISPDTGHTAFDIDTGESWNDKIDGDWFSLPRGEVNIDFIMNGADEDSRLRLRYQERHGRAW